MAMGHGIGAYRPRHPERTAFRRLISRYLDWYVRTDEARYGPLWRVVPRKAGALLECRQPRNGGPAAGSCEGLLPEGAPGPRRSA